MRALLAAMSHCRKYIDEHSQDDKGCAQRIVRDLHDVLAELPTFRPMVGDKSSVNKLHTRKLAEGQLGLIHQHIKQLVKEHDQEKTKAVQDSVAAHPVFGQLKASLTKQLPKTAYILLFRQGENGEPELITHKSEDGRVFTRMRPQEFRDDLHLHKTYNKATIVGAAVIAEKELVAVIGQVPPPTETKDQLRALLSVSSEAAGRPARQFVESNEVLNALHDLARTRKMPKESYVLLFEAAEDNLAAGAEDSVAAGGSPLDEQDDSGVEAQEPLAESGLPPAATDEETQEPLAESGLPPAATDDVEAQEPLAESGLPPAATDEETQEPLPDSGLPPAAVGDVPPLKIVIKQGQDGKVLSRFWPSDFAIRHKLFENFRDKPPVLGAAVIREKELLHVIGNVPQPSDNQSPIDALLQASWQAVEQPYVDFVSQHEVLKGLYELSTGEFRTRDVTVILFVQGESGKLEILQHGRDRQRTARVPLGQFQNAKALFDRFAKRPLVGASVLSEDTREKDQHGRFGKRDGQRNRDDRKRDDRRDRDDRDGQNKNRDSDKRNDRHSPSRKPVVLAAFGRTPLKVNILATPDTFRRLGLDID